MGAEYIVVQNDVDFKTRFGKMAGEFRTTGIFDGVGGYLLNGLLDLRPNNSATYLTDILEGIRTTKCQQEYS